MLAKPFFAKKLLFKSTILMLIFLFAFQPLAPAFAQLLDSGDTAVDAPAVDAPAVDAPAPEQTPTEAEPVEEPQGEELPALAAAGEEPANNQTQNSPLAQKLPEIDKNTGALNYSYPIVVPPGRNNLQPDLALSYNSNLSDQNSVFGYGWAINIPYIQRLNKAGTDSLYSSGYFYSSLDGELSSVDGTLYIVRTENGQFNKYTFLNNQWTLIAKNGTQYKFGYDIVSRQDDLANLNNVYKWMLQEVRDTNDNYISYSYFKDAGQIYPLAIRYTGNGLTDGIFEIDFQRISRTDNFVSYTTGFAVNSNYLINEIDAKINGNWVSKYVLNYTQSQNGNRPLLTSVTLSGKDGFENTTTLPATTFNYQSSNSDWNPLNPSWNIPLAPTGFAWDLRSRPPQFADLNGDGLPDLLITGQTTVYNNGYDQKNFQYFNTGNGWVTAGDSFNYPSPPPGYNWNLASRHPQFTDLNGDGLTDLVILAYGCTQINNSYSCDMKDYQYLNNGKGWIQTSLWTFPSLPAGESSWLWRSAHPQFTFTDLNGDGLVDLVLAASRFISNAVGSILIDYEYINNGQGWIKANDSFHFPSAPTGFEWNLYSRPPQFADLNGDDLTDLVIVGQETNNPTGNTSKDYQYLNTGSGWTQTLMWNFPTLPAGETAWQWPAIPPQFTDLNGDGLTDLVLVASRFISNAVGSILIDYEYINNGQGWTKAFDSLHYPIAPENNGLWSFYPIAPQLIDINGDSLPDIFAVLRVFDYSQNSPSYRDENYQYISSGQRQDLLNQINYSQGGNTAVSYKASTQYIDDFGNLANKSPYPLFTVSQITTSDGFSGSSTFSYQYQGGRYYYNNPFDKQFAGYNLIIQTDSAGNIAKTYYHTANETDSTRGEFEDNYFKIGKPYRIEQYDNTGKLFLASANKWEATNLAGSAGFVKLTQTIEQNFNGSTNHKDKAESFVYDTATGNQTQ
ncbi:MAG: FG-GAP-like repeat-containing protein, partial [Patescibacteria group bacterium]